MPADLAAQIDGFLKGRGSPMAGLGSTFVAAGKKYGVDPRLVVGIAGIESSFGKHTYGDHNAWGWGPGIPFASWDEGISTVTQGLKSGYIDQGRKTPAQIVSKYAPGSDGNDEGNWATVVAGFMRELGAAPALTTSKRTVAAPAAPSPLPTPTPLPSPVSYTPSHSGLRNAVLANLQATAAGSYRSPSEMLSGVVQGALADDEANRAMRAQAEAYNASLQALGTPVAPTATTPEARPAGPPQTSPAEPTSPVAKLTSAGGEHGTSGLPGYTGIDYFAPAGSAALAPIDGQVIRLSGRDPSEGAYQGAGGPLGWSVYIRGTDGKTYYMTHMGSRDVRKGDAVKAGEKIGTVADYDAHGRPSHIHMGWKAN